MPRKPFVREVMPNVISAGGYSGHGVMLSNFVGKLYAETVAGNRDRLKLFEELKIPAFPGRPALPRAAAVPGAQLVRAARPDLMRGEAAISAFAAFCLSSRRSLRYAYHAMSWLKAAACAAP